jgi:hypothetical protein
LADRKKLWTLSPEDIEQGIEEIAQNICAAEKVPIEKAREKARTSGLWTLYAGSLMDAALKGKRDVNMDGLKMYKFDKFLPEGFKPKVPRPAKAAAKGGE